MQSLGIFILVCILLMLPFLAYLIYQFVLYVKRKKPFLPRQKKEEYIFYEIDEKGNLIRLD